MMAPAVMATQFPGKCQQEDCKVFRILPVNIGISSPVFLKCQRTLVLVKLESYSLCIDYKYPLLDT